MTNSMKIILTILIFYSSINFFLRIGYSAIVINEIMYDPDQCSDSFCEWIELYNTEDTPVNLTGYTLCGNELLAGYVNSSDGEIYANTGMNISGKGFVIITDGGTGTNVYEKFNVNSSSLALHTNTSSICGGLSNTGDTVYLADSSGTLVDQVTYSNSWGANGNNKTLERIDPTGNSNSSINWKEGDVNGTPGFKNSVTPNEHDLAVYSSNITFSPPDPSPRTGVNISVSIQNKGISNETNVNISIYNISDSALTLIHSQLLNITKRDSSSITIKWNNTVKGNSTILVRFENFTDDNITDNNVTKNITFDFHLVINEIMYNPPEEIGSDADFEWLEIYNNATYTENLTGWILQCDSSSKLLSGNLSSNSYLVFAKDRTQFYTYYSSSIITDSESCSLNNDGDTIKLIFNDSGIYHEETVSYSPNWGADGTGYSLEKKIPTTDNNSTNWAESKAYAGTPGARNNPDNRIKGSLRNQTTVIYRTNTEIIYIPKEDPDYKIVSFPEFVYVNEPFKTTVSLRSSREEIVTVYSYVYDGKNIVSQGFDGSNWKSTWTANKKDIKIGPTAVYTEFENKIEPGTPPGKYQFKVRIKDKTDLTRTIDVLPERKELQSVKANYSKIIVHCEQSDNQAKITVNGSTQESILLLHFSKGLIKNETLNVNRSLTYTINLEEGYNSVIFIQNNRILDLCIFLYQKPSIVTGRVTQPLSTTNKIFIFIKSWLEKLSFLNIFRNI
ncbi:MAG: lamin tail domain-containing protein [Candidatus Aenigmatarchaeota archaeon]